MIIDDDLHAKMCMKIPAGGRLTAVMDCCTSSFSTLVFLGSYSHLLVQGHSGTGLDLPYEYLPSGMADTSSGKKGKKVKKAKKAKKSKKGGGGGPVQDGYLPGTTPGDCMLFSGCRYVFFFFLQASMLPSSFCSPLPSSFFDSDDQTSADAVIGGKATGAMTWVRSFNSFPPSCFLENSQLF